MPNQLAKRDFDLILCTLTQTDQLHTDYMFDFAAVKIMMIATPDRQLFVQIRGSWAILCEQQAEKEDTL